MSSYDIRDMEEIAGMLRESFASNKKKEKPIMGKCRYCGGNLYQSFIRDGPIVIGGKQRMMPNGYHCDNCGLKYEHLPKQER